MPLLHLVERFANGVWRVLQEWPSGDPLLTGPRTRCSYAKEPDTAWQDALGAYCWQRPSGGMIHYSDPDGGVIGSVDSLETLHTYGFTPAFGEPIESGATE